MFVPYISLPNTLAGRFVVPEILQDEATPEVLAQAVVNQLGTRIEAAAGAGVPDIHSSLRQNTRPGSWRRSCPAPRVLQQDGPMGGRAANARTWRMSGEPCALVLGWMKRGEGRRLAPFRRLCHSSSARPIRGLADSKQLEPERREELALRIRERALAFAVASASVEEIDCMNILQATLIAMRRAVESLSMAPTRVVIDGNRCPALQFPTHAVVGGDAKVRVISAASILAKTARDVSCWTARGAARIWFDRRKGYSTPEHLAALRLHGASQFHRRSARSRRHAPDGFVAGNVPSEVRLPEYRLASSSIERCVVSR